jgi:hypothetical protein
MTQDEIIELIKQAGFDIDGLNEGQAIEFYEEWLNKMGTFAKLVAAKECEACALLAATPVGTIAREIRARGEA